MSSELTRIERAYDSIAEEWAETFSDEHDNKPRDREILDRFSREIGTKTPVWDLGCGPGNTTKYLRNLGLEVSGLDLSGKMLEQARKAYPEIPFIKGNLLQLELENDTIAGIVAFYAIVHFAPKEVETAFFEIFRVLQPAGIFLLTFHIGEETIHIEDFLGKPFDIDFMFHNTDTVKSCLKKCGFENIDIIEREPYPQVEYQSRRAYVFAKKPGTETGKPI